jgi:hypothetical protein
MLLEKQAKKEIEKNTRDFYKSIKNDLLGLSQEKHTREQVLNWHIFNILFSKKENIISWSNAKILKELKRRLKIEDKEKLKKAEKKIKYIKSLQFKSIDIKCKIEWYNNRVWGYCPKGDYYGANGYKYIGGVTGCGYDKLSSWTAKAFNQDNILKSYIFNFCEKHHINKDNIRKKLGYGINIFHGQPYFDGGVGLSSHINVLKNLGFKVVNDEGKKWNYLHFYKKIKSV